MKLIIKIKRLLCFHNWTHKLHFKGLTPDYDYFECKICSKKIINNIK